MTANNFEPTKMAPNGPKAQSVSKGAIDKSLNPRLPEDLLSLDHSDPAKGPHPGHVQVACQYTLEQKLRRMLKDYGSDSAREDSYRLQGVSMMDGVREALHLCVLLSVGAAQSGACQLTSRPQAGSYLRHSGFLLSPLPTLSSRYRVQSYRCRALLVIPSLQGRRYHQEVQGDLVCRIQH